MKKQEFDILNSLYNGSIGRAICSYDIETKNALADNETYRRMIKSGYICENDNTLNELGRNALENSCGRCFNKIYPFIIRTT